MNSYKASLMEILKQENSENKLQNIFRHALNTKPEDQRDSQIQDGYYEKINICRHEGLPNNLSDRSMIAYIDVLKDFILNEQYEKLEDSKFYPLFYELREEIAKELTDNPEKYDPSGGNGDYIGY